MITTQVQRGRVSAVPVTVVARGNVGAPAGQTARPAGSTGVVVVTLVSKGLKGDPGMTISSEPPANPQINDLWIQLPSA